MSKTGKTYRIVSIHTDKIYVGSTTQKLSKRLSEHVCDYKRFLLGKTHNNVQSFEIIKLGDYQIELLEDHGQVTKLELLKFERAAMLLYSDMIVNDRIPSDIGNGKEYHVEYYLKNKEKIKERDAEWYLKNKEKINEQFTCDICNGKYTCANKTKHFKSQKHIKAMTTIE